MNRNVLKVVACVTMLIDHIGMILFPDILALRIIGRVSFPLFCFFIAEGLHYTRDFNKYLLRLTIFALISQIPYYFVSGSIIELNIIFLFVLAAIIVKSLENIKQHKVLAPIALTLSIGVEAVFQIFGMIDFSWFGILLIVVFYFWRDQKIKYLLAGLLMLIYPAFNILTCGYTLSRLIQSLAIISLIFIYFYNGEKGKLNLKYVFYIFYPVHLSILVLIKLLIL